MNQEIVKILLPNKGVLFVVCPRDQVETLLKRIEQSEIDVTVENIDSLIGSIDLCGLDVYVPNITYVDVE